jgi:hypothetical protein
VNLPAEQSKHPNDFKPVEYFPKPQLTHEVAPLMSTYVPALQAKHSQTGPAKEYEPGLHRTQAE